MMRFGITLSAVLTFAACGSMNAGGEPAGTTPEGEVSPSPEQPEDGASHAPAPAAEAAVDITGLWENASCGERKYRRKITFLAEDSRFVAVDEVAPCPPGAKCVWSGIINWHGSWVMDNRTIRLEAKPIKSSKMPEKLPETFVVLNDDPVSIGEQADGVICPYQKTR